MISALAFLLELPAMAQAWLDQQWDYFAERLEAARERSSGSRE